MSDAGVSDGVPPPVSGFPPSTPPVGRATAFKIVATVALVSGIIGVMLYSSARDGAQYYKHVDEVTTNLPALKNKRLQVHGNVIHIEQKKNSLDYRFQIESRAPRQHAVITAEYTGIVPDTFKNGSEVVASGMLAANDTLKVANDGIMAKCPSKYDPSKQAALSADKSGIKLADKY